MKTIPEIKKESEAKRSALINQYGVFFAWLSFPETKPKQYSWVLVTVKSPIDKWVEMAGFDGDKFQLPGRGDTTFVTHWMPIPEPACC